MRVLVLGASGATGKLVVMQLIKRQINTRVAVRESAILSAEILKSPLVEIKRGNIAEFNDSEMAILLEGSDAIVSCLGHNITIKGMFGNPRNLVSDAIINVCETARKRAEKKVKLILMSTTAYSNVVIGEKNSFGENIVLSIIKLLLPPHRDNVKAASYLQREIGKKTEGIEWVAVRPDTLINEDNESAYEVYNSPLRSPIFNAGKTSRINVSHFMVELLTRDDLWREWQFKTPVVYNK
jgi:nucleoside-diphosphate-sugar epimerase